MDEAEVADLRRRLREAEAKLAAADRDQRYRELFEHTSDGVFLLEVHDDGRFSVTDFSPAEVRLIGIAAEDARGKNLDELFPPAVAAELAANYRRCVEAGAPITYTEVLEVPAGRRYFSTTLVPMKDDRGQCRRIIGVARNVTEQAEAEEALRDSERRFRSLIQNSSDGTLLCSAEGEVHFRSASLRRLLGYPEAMKLGPLREYVHPDDLAAFEADWAKVLADRGPVMVAGRVRHLDGSYRLMEGVCVNYLTDPALRGVVMNFRDVTERKQLEAQLLAADRMASMGTLAAGMAHEINNPLSYLIANLGFAEEALRSVEEATGPVEGPKARQALAAARDGAERIRKIVRGLQAYSRVEEAPLSAVDVNPVVDATANLAAHELVHRARLDRVYGKELPRARANDGQLGQVVLNLLVNAAHAMPEREGSEKVITLSTRSHGGRVLIEVKDTGTGIAPEHLPRLFDPFFTTKPVGVGTGLGLYVCQQLVTAMGGTISVESAVGGGSTFTISLAALAPGAPSSVGPSSQPPPAPPAAPPQPAVQQRARLLAIDDEPQIGRVLKLGLRPHDVTPASSALEALERLRRGERFDLLLCDLMMPGMTGMELHALLTKELPEQARRMIFLTGGAFTQRAQEFLETVDAPQVEKPFDLRALRAQIESLLAQHGPA